MQFAVGTHWFQKLPFAGNHGGFGPIPVLIQLGKAL